MNFSPLQAEGDVGEPTCPGIMTPARNALATLLLVILTLVIKLFR